MNIIKLSLPPLLEQSLTKYALTVLDTPERYITPTLNSSSPIKPYDTTAPGITDEFILNWNLSSVNWGAFNLQKTKCELLSEIAFPPMSLTIQIIEFLEEKLGKQLIKPSGHFLYPEGGYMGWHTNGDMPGTRVYLAYSPITNGSCFKYVDRSGIVPKIITDWDDMGWTIRIFDVSYHPDKYFWHCVDATNAPRISYGYWFN
jgi:hypothetical protein